MSSEWQKWCRLCGKTEIENDIVKFETIPNFISLIRKHFSITVRMSIKVLTIFLLIENAFNTCFFSSIK